MQYIDTMWWVGAKVWGECDKRMRHTAKSSDDGDVR